MPFEISYEDDSVVSAVWHTFESISVYISFGHRLAPPPARAEPFSIKGSFRRSAGSIEEVGELRIRLRLTRVLLHLGFTSQAL